MGRTQSSSSHARPNRGGARGGRGSGRGGRARHQSSSSRANPNPNANSAKATTPTAGSTPSHKANAQKRKRTIHIKDGIAIRKSIQQLKAELRGAERLHAKKLASGDFAADASAQKRSESKIAAIKTELASTQSLDKAKVEKFDVIYRSVKFFERVKASRRVEQLRKQIAKATAAAEEGKVKELEAALKGAELDLVYVLHYPAATKYVALWPTSASASSKDQADAEESSSDDNDDDAGEQPALSEKAIQQRDQVRAHLQHLIDHGLINVAETVRACLGDPGEEREKKKTKKKGDTEEDIKHKQIGHLLRGVGVAGLSDDEEDSSARRVGGAAASSSSSSDEESGDDGDMDMDQDDFFMS